jgi:hypothetical protein
MSTIKLKGNWNQQKSKLKMQFSNLEEQDDELYNVEEELLRSLNGNKKPKKKPVVRKDSEW